MVNYKGITNEEYSDLNFSHEGKNGKFYWYKFYWKKILNFIYNQKIFNIKYNINYNNY